ncbi:MULTISPECIES: tRNA uracil 4-sulfurtransferase ThiI [Nitrincola]|uniref:tRNA sulfurtransferase n=1 Tax=Nitrincola nitratireducens TaxID=1229521 RepID=W9VRS3_9GAMM|nr:MULTISPECIES: tRNA uracil 4-sulfurtransferase ThiI [Nitrincola]EXJ13120.1 tRNA sulfurtransferase [Nitrincola nitratireducens]
MKFIIRLFPEITIKSRGVRQQYIKQLKKNIRHLVKPICELSRVGGCWDLLEVETDPSTSTAQIQAISDALTRIPGIHHFMETQEHPLPDIEGICTLTLSTVAERLQNKTFAVRVQRAGIHSYSSLELQRKVGAYLLEHSSAAGVNLTSPDELVLLQIHHDRLFIVGRRREGLGGYPLGTQENVVTLMSGGFDSSVAAYQMLQRGIYTHFVFFRLGGAAHEEGVKRVAHYLWSQYCQSHQVKFVTVPFEGVVEHILTHVDQGLMGVILKRAMIRCADQLARKLKTSALVTGEAIAQVSSQTLTNLQIIDQTVPRLILRPLISANKQLIIDQARAIGVAELCERIPEYCGVISQRPTSRAKLTEIEAAEDAMDSLVLQDAVTSAVFQSITQVLNETPDIPQVEEGQIASEPDDRVVIIDIRAPDERESSPLKNQGYPVIELPFYRLHSQFANLDQSKEYWLYCDQGIMSKLQTQNLLSAGFSNIKICPARLLAE